MVDFFLGHVEGTTKSTAASGAERKMAIMRHEISNNKLLEPHVRVVHNYSSAVVVGYK